MNKTALLPCVILLSACSLIPDYRPPEPPVPQQWPNSPDTAATPATPQAGSPALGEVAWQQFFTDPTLQRLIRLALDDNRDLRVAVLNIEVARATYRISAAELQPRVDAGVASSAQRTPRDLTRTVPKQAATTHEHDANLSVTAFELDLFGRLHSLSQQAQENYLATAEARSATQVALIAEVANAYLTLLGDRRQLALSERTLATREQSLRLVERRLELGLSTELDRAQAKSAVESARAAATRYVRLVELDLNALQLLVGAPLAEASLAGAAQAPEPREPMALCADLPVGLPSEVLLQRPDVMQAEHALKAANANIGAARAAFFPSISLTALAGLASPALSHLFESDSSTWTFSPSVSVPIFDAGRNQANLEAATANREIALARYEKAIQSAFREVSDALVARATLGNQLAAQRALVDAAATSYRLSDARYRQGVDSYLGVLDAERTLYAAQLDLIQVEVQQLSNQVSLYKALGGGRF